MKTGQIQTQSLCAHCGDPCGTDGPSSADLHFCCAGCQTVYGILAQHDLCEYYQLSDHPGISQRTPVRKDKFAFLDEPEIAARLIRFSDGRETHLTFYLPQMHCSSCLWLLENIHRLDPGILSSRVDFTAKEAQLVFDPGATTIRRVVETLAGIGYEPHLSLDDVSGRSLRKLDRTRWYKIGVAGFAFSNIMMLSFPEYLAGEGAVEPTVARTLSFLSIGLSIPVLFYAAQEFFVNAWAGLRNRYLNIDAPVALALVITFGRSLYEILSHTGPGYLDSLSGIVFFMLIGRWLQDKTYRTISFDRDYRSFFPIAVDVVTPDGLVSRSVQDLRPNDVIRIHHAELIPADAMLSKGRAAIDYSFVTGESVPVPVEIGELVYAGGRQTEGILELVVVKEVSQSYLTGLWNRVRKGDEAAAAPRFVDRLSRYFTYIVFIIAAVAAIYWSVQGRDQLMWNALTTILIVACPCALLLAANFTRGNIVRVLSREKFYLKNADVLERLAAAGRIVWDKTGTLTANQHMDVTYRGQSLDAGQKQWIAALLVHSTHPLSKAVLRSLDLEAIEPASHFKVVTGQGLEGWVDERHIRIGSPAFTNVRTSGPAGSQITVRIDQEPIGVFEVRNRYRPGIFDLLRRLGSRYGQSVLSGDNDSEENTLREVMGPQADLRFRQSPADKLDVIRDYQSKDHQPVIMIGDGLNDAGALAESAVGIAISEADNPFTPAADAILHASVLPRLDRMMDFVRKSRHIILFTFAVSIVYNVIGLYFAVQGLLSPLIAAVLMPSSSLTIILITYGLTQYHARRLFRATRGNTADTGPEATPSHLQTLSEA